MTVTFEWYNAEKTVILYNFSEHWQWEEMENAFDENARMLENMTHTVHFICDLSDSPNLPPQLFTKVPRLQSKAYPHTGYIIIITRWKIIESIVGVLERLGVKMLQYTRFVSSMQEADGIITALFQEQRNGNS